VPHEIKAWAHSFVFDVLLPFYGVFLAVFLVALAIYLLLVAWHLLPLLRFDKACLAGNSPDPHEALRMARRARVLRIRFVPVASELRALELLGDADRAVQIASDSTAVPRPAWFTSRLQYAFYVAGRYRQALELEMGHRPSDARHASFSTSAALIELNRAAAEMSLGSWGAAEARLEGPLSDADSIPPVRTLRLLGLAGVLIHRGDGPRWRCSAERREWTCPSSLDRSSTSRARSYSCRLPAGTMRSKRSERAWARLCFGGTREMASSSSRGSSWEGTTSARRSGTPGRQRRTRGAGREETGSSSGATSSRASVAATRQGRPGLWRSSATRRANRPGSRPRARKETPVVPRPERPGGVRPTEGDPGAKWISEEE
jgi:hypothetical protein